MAKSRIPRAGQRTPADRALSILAGRQHGIVSAAQLRALGLSKDAIHRRAKCGRLHLLYRGVYAVGHVALGPRSRQLAAVLASGPTAALSHRSAAELWGLAPSSGQIEVTARVARKPGPAVIVRRSRRLGADDTAAVDAIPVTSVARTLVDLADVLPERRLRRAVHEAEVRRLFDLAEMERAMARLPGRRGARALGRVLADYTGGPPVTRSKAERLFLRLCRQGGLPAPQANVQRAGYEIDFLWEQARLAVEVDGLATHHSARRFYEDRRRDRELAAHGIQVIRVTWRDLQGNDGGLARELRAILRRPAGSRAR